MHFLIKQGTFIPLEYINQSFFFKRNLLDKMVRHTEQHTSSCKMSGNVNVNSALSIDIDVKILEHEIPEK